MMAEKVQSGTVQNQHISNCKETVCISTKKIFDSCRDKDCIEDLRVFLTEEGQCVIEKGSSVKPRSAELLYVYIDVEPIPFNCGYYTVEIQFFYRIEADVYGCGIRPYVTVSGLATFSKRVMLFGSDGSAKIFSSKVSPNAVDKQLLMTTNMPEAVVEVVDPMILDMKLVELCNCKCCETLGDIPDAVCEFFEEEIVNCCEGRRLYVTLGQFSIIRLERPTQILIPSYSYCVPEKDCTGIGGADEEPCDMFRRIGFPVDSFFPPNVLPAGECR